MPVVIFENTPIYLELSDYDDDRLVAFALLLPSGIETAMTMLPGISHVLNIIMKILILAAAWMFASSTPHETYLPVVHGSINTNVRQDNIQETICVSGWTKTIRPSSSLTTKLKIKQMAELKLEGQPSAYEEDHLISLELGGNPTDPNNLWPEPWKGRFNAHQKDKLENRLHRMVCSGQITLAQAQRAISHDWTKTFLRYYSETS